MKDSTSKNIAPTDKVPYSANIDSIHQDLKGIRCEIAHYRKDQKKDRFAVNDDTVFTVVVTISIFVIGIIIDRILKWYDRTMKAKDLRKFFEYNIKHFSDNALPKLKEAYHDYSENTTIDTGITSSPPKVLSSHFQRLINTNFEELFKAYQTKEALTKVLGNIEFVDKVQIEVREFHDRVYADSGQVRDELEKLSYEYMSLLSKYVRNDMETNVRYGHSDTYTLISQSIKTYYTEFAETRKLSKFYTDIILVIQERIVQTGEYQTNSILNDVADKGGKLSYVVNNLKLKTREITDQYKVFSGYMNDANDIIAKHIKELK